MAKLDVADKPMTEEELDAGALMILACVANWSMIKVWPRIKLPHCGALPALETLAEYRPVIDCDTTFMLNGRPWLILK